jgi:hypothetical protein
MYIDFAIYRNKQYQGGYFNLLEQYILKLI